MSISTVQQAYHVLESQQLILPQPRSGYYVAPRKANRPVPGLTRPAQRPVEISQWDSVRELFNPNPERNLYNLGGGGPDVSQSSIKPLWKSLTRFCQRQDLRVLNYGNMYGALDSDCQLAAEDIVITTGCQEALFTELRSLCREGDIVAVESPTFPGTLQTLRGLGIKVVEIPTDAVTGISLAAGAGVVADKSGYAGA